jgi:hypothetical protein
MIARIHAYTHMQTHTHTWFEGCTLAHEHAATDACTEWAGERNRAAPRSQSRGVCSDNVTGGADQGTDLCSGGTSLRFSGGPKTPEGAMKAAAGGAGTMRVSAIPRHRVSAPAIERA